MGYSASQVRVTLVSKLRAEEEKGRKHLTYRILDTQGNFIGQTYLSHGVKDINDPLLGMMAKQLKIQRRDFVSLILCELGFSDYVRIAIGL